MNKKVILAYRLLLLVLAFVGVYLEIAKLGVGMLMYYTVFYLSPTSFLECGRTITGRVPSCCA